MYVCNGMVTCLHWFAVGQYGAVSTLDLSRDGTRLLCGHAKGLVRIDVYIVDASEPSNLLYLNGTKSSVAFGSIGLMFCFCFAQHGELGGREGGRGPA